MCLLCSCALGRCNYSLCQGMHEASVTLTLAGTSHWAETLPSQEIVLLYPAKGVLERKVNGAREVQMGAAVAVPLPCLGLGGCWSPSEAEEPATDMAQLWSRAGVRGVCSSLV